MNFENKDEKNVTLKTAKSAFLKYSRTGSNHSHVFYLYLSMISMPPPFAPQELCISLANGIIIFSITAGCIYNNSLAL
jgi:hypothetical protein